MIEHELDIARRGSVVGGLRGARQQAKLHWTREIVRARDPLLTRTTWVGLASKS